MFLTLPSPLSSRGTLSDVNNPYDFVPTKLSTAIEGYNNNNKIQHLYSAIFTEGEMGWRTPYHQQLLAVTRPWCRLINIDVEIEKSVFVDDGNGRTQET